MIQKNRLAEEIAAEGSVVGGMRCMSLLKRIETHFSVDQAPPSARGSHRNPRHAGQSVAVENQDEPAKSYA